MERQLRLPHHLPGWIKRANAILALVGVAFLQVSCNQTGTLAIQNGSLGLSVYKVRGDNQVIFPSEVTRSNLTLQVMSADGSKPASGVSVEFSDLSGIGAQILSPTAQTDSNGYAMTAVRMPAEHLGESFQIQARVVGTSKTVTFTLTVSNNQPGSRFVLDTLNHGIETAGVPFNFIVTVQSDDGQIDTTYNGTKALLWNFVSADSWAGNHPTTPPAVSPCVFTSGMCIVPASTLMDARQATKVWVGDGPDGLIDVFAQEVTVLANTASQVTFADKAGGPSQGAVVLTSTDTISYTADDSSKTFYGAIIDNAGNFIRDATTGTWSTANEMKFDTTLAPGLISSHLDLVSGPVTHFTPTQAGKGAISLSGAGFPAVTKNLIVEPGAPASLLVDTEHGGVEQPGYFFKISVKPIDAKGNIVVKSDGTSPVNNIYTMEYSFDATVAGVNTGSVVDPGVLNSQGCSGFFRGVVPAPGTQTLTIEPQCSQGDTTLTDSTNTFINGVQSSNSIDSGIINAAVGVSPVLTARLRYQLGPPAVWLTGSKAISVSPGPAARIQLYRTFNDGTSWACDPFRSGQRDLPGCHWTGTDRDPVAAGIQDFTVAGDSAYTYYAGLEDQGGNFLGNVALDTFNANSTIVQTDITHQIVTIGATSVSKITYLPTKINISASDTFTLAKGTVSTEIPVNTHAGNLAHYTLSVDDGVSLNAPSVLNRSKIYLTAVDPFNNPIDSQGGHSFSVTTTGAIASPKPTAPIVPNGTYGITISRGRGIFDNSGAGWLFPNSNSPVTLTVVDTTASPNVTSSITFTPVAGPAVDFKLRDAANGGGSDVTNGTFNVDTDTAKNLYATLYDSEMNFTDAIATWTYTPIAPLGTMTANPAYLTIAADTTGSGTVTAVSQTLSASTTVTVNPGTLDHIDITTTGAGIETAGVPFQTSVILKDKKNNTKTDISGSKATNISIQGANPSVYGQNFTGPTGTSSINFTNGVMDAQTYTFYNSTDTPLIVITTQGKGQSFPLTLNSGPFDHVRIKQSPAGNYFAGDNLIFTVTASDVYGNPAGGAAASGKLIFAFVSSLGGQDITASTLSSASDISSGSDILLTGNLSSGSAQVVVKATEAGGPLQVQGSIDTLTNHSAPSGGVDSVTVLPRTVISSIDFDPVNAPPTTYLASASATMPLFRVRLLDTYGNVITTNSTTNVVLDLTTGTRTLNGATTATASSGYAQFANIKYAKAESIVLRATEQTSNHTVSQTITVNPGPATQTIVRLPGQAYTAGVTSLAAAISGTPTAQSACGSFSVEVLAVDDGFNTATSYANTVSLVSSDGKASLPAQTNFSSGVASFTFTNRVAGTQTLTPNTGLGTNNASSSYTVNTGSASQVLLLLPNQSLVPGAANATSAVSGSASTQVAGTGFNVTANLTDSCFNLVNNSTNTVSIAGFGGTFTGFTTGSYPGSGNVQWNGTQTLAAGSATFNLDYFNTTTGVTLTASNNGSFTNNASSTLVVQNAAADHLLFSAYPATGTSSAGANLGIKVKILDQYDNLVTTGADATSTIELTRSGGTGKLNGSSATLAKPAIAGLADFSTGSFANVQDTSTGNSISAAKTSGTALTSISGPNTFDIRSAALHHFNVTGATSPSTAGTSHNIVVTAQDQYNNTVLDYTGTVSLSSGDTQFVNPGSYAYTAADSGVHTFSGAILKTTGNQTITASGSSKTGSQTPIVITADSAQKLVLSGPSSVTAGSCSGTLTVQTQDQYGNAAIVTGGDTITLTGAAGGTAEDFYTAGCGATLGGIAGSRTLSIASGSTSTTFAFKGTLAQTLTFHANDGTLAQGNLAFTINYNSSSLTMTKTAGDSQTGTVNQNLATQIKVHVVDNYGNLAVGQSVNFNAGGNGSVSPTTVIVDSSGDAASTWKLGTTAGSQSRTVSTSGATSVVFSATASADVAHHLAFTSGKFPVANQIKGLAFTTQPEVQVQDQFNNTVPSSAYTITLTPYLVSNCTVGNGTLSNNSGTTDTSGKFAVSGMSYTSLSTGAETIYIAATSSPALTQACAPGTTVYDTIQAAASATPVNTGGSSTITTNVGGGVPPLTIAVTANASGTTTGSATCAAPCASGASYAYTAGQIGGGGIDTITVTDAKGNTATANITVNGAKNDWSGTTAYGTVSADTTQTFTLTNSGNGTSGPISITMTNCKRDATTIPCTDMWYNASGANCQGATLSASATCTVDVTFLEATGTGATAGNYTMDLTATASGGGTAKITLMGTK